MKNTILGCMAILLYIQIRILKSPLFWVGVPNIDVWSKESDMVKNDIAVLTLFWVHLWSFLLWGWIGLAIFGGIELLIVISVYVYTWIESYIKKAE